MVSSEHTAAASSLLGTPEQEQAEREDLDLRKMGTSDGAITSHCTPNRVRSQ